MGNSFMLGTVRAQISRYRGIASHDTRNTGVVVVSDTSEYSG